MTPVKIEITDEDFLQFFDLVTWDNQLKDGHSQFKARLSRLYGLWSYYLQHMQEKVENIEEINTILSQNIIQMHDEHFKLREWFFENYTEFTTENNYLVIEGDINMDIFKQITLLKSSIITLQRQHNDVKEEDDVIRRCQYCHLVWSRVEKCKSGRTTCGNRPKTHDIDGGW
jgi:hypothetical protein